MFISHVYILLYTDNNNNNYILCAHVFVSWVFKIAITIGIYRCFRFQFLHLFIASSFVLDSN